MRHKEGVRGRIDLGARLGPALTAYIGLTTRGVPAAHLKQQCSFAAVLCQQGLQFFPDRAGAVGEMCRVGRHDGVVLVSTWASERPLGLFGPMTEALRAVGVEAHPPAFDPKSYSLGAGELRRLLSDAGLREVVVKTVELDAVWRNAEGCRRDGDRHALRERRGAPRRRPTGGA